MRPIAKSLIALIAGASLLVLGAVPSGATPGTITAGTLGVNLIPPLSTSLAPGGGGGTGCTGASASLDVTMSSSTAGTATLSITGAAFKYGTTTFFFSGSGSGPVTISGSTASAGPIAVTGANVYPETSPGSCTPNFTSPKCGTIATAPPNHISLSGSWSGTVTPPALSGTAVLSGSGGIGAAGCTPPFSALNGKTVTFTNMTVVF